MKKIEKYDVIVDKKKYSQKIRIVIVDDQKFVRSFLETILATDTNFQVVGTANNGKDALKKIESLQPDVILIDLEMPEMDGVTATEIITLEYPQCKILVLSSYQDSEHLQKALHAGANGYILKSSSPQEIINAVYSISQGHSQLSPGLLEKVLTTKIEIVPEARRESKIILSPQNLQESAIAIRKKLPKIICKPTTYCLLVTAFMVIPIAFLTKVERTITALGTLETKGKTVTVNAPVKGKVAAIKVKEGAIITKGQTLIQLESPLVTSQLQQQQQKLIQQQNQLANLNLLKKQQQLALRTKQQESKAQQLEQQSSIDLLQDNLDNLKANYSNQLGEQSNKLEEALSAISQAKSASKLAQIRHEAATEKVNQYQQAYQKEVISKERLLEAEQAVRESKINLDQAESEVEQTTVFYQTKQNNYNQKQQQLSAAIKQAALRLQEQQNIYQSLIQTNNAAIFDSQETVNDTEYKILTLQGEIAQNNSLIEELKLQLEQRALFTPTDGILFHLSVKEIGSIVQPGQVIAKIVPQKSSLILKAKISLSESNSDLLTVGLPVRLKFDAYPFSNYGFVSGRLTEISPTFISQNSSEREVANREDREKTYNIQVELDRNYLLSKEKQILLTPGQSATAEIIVGKSRLISAFFKPLDN